MFKVEPISLRFVFVIAIIVALMIPLLTVFALVQERKGYYDQAVYDVAQAWSASQAIAGPLVLISVNEGSSKDRSAYGSNDWIYMPSQLEITLASTHEMRNRGIYQIPVFTAQIEATADFQSIDLDAIDGEIEQVAIVLGISDSRGVRNASIAWNGKKFESQSSAQLYGIGNTVQVAIEPEELLRSGTVTVEVELRGSFRFSVLPVGDITEVTMQSDWPDPSFDGRYLPDTREVNESGFVAQWSTHALSRGFPSVVRASDLNRALNSIRSESGRSSDLGFTILTLNTPYRAVERSIKYGVLFIVMTMVSIICVELVSKTRFHIIQYGVVGAGLVLFFLTLLSLSEHVGFGVGYILAAFVLATMNVSYLWFVSRSRSVAFAVGFVLLVLYVALYFVLQLNEYALLVGSILLLFLLAALMYATRSLSPNESLLGSESGEKD